VATLLDWWISEVQCPEDFYFCPQIAVILRGKWIYVYFELKPEFMSNIRAKKAQQEESG